MQPASTILKKLGGPTKISRGIGIHRVRVSNWARPKESGGTGGVVPQRHIPALLAYAKSIGEELGPEDFFPSAEAR